MKTKLLVECLDLTKNFSGKKALDAVNLQIGRGKIIGLLGPNGSGKTTLIKILNGLLEPTFGSVLIDGEKPGPYTKSIVSYLPDRTYFADWMKVRDIFDMFCDFYKDFAASLSNFDEVVLTDIYPAREEPIPGVSSKLIYDNIKAGVEKTMIKKDDVLDYVRNRDFAVLEILGAGNLDDLVPQIAEIIKAKEK